MRYSLYAIIFLFTFRDHSMNAGTLIELHES